MHRLTVLELHSSWFAWESQCRGQVLKCNVNILYSVRSLMMPSYPATALTGLSSQESYFLLTGHFIPSHCFNRPCFAGDWVTATILSLGHITDILQHDCLHLSSRRAQRILFSLYGVACSVLSFVLVQ